jgi:hypothetical protein
MSTINHGVITVLRDLIEADTAFFRVASVLPPAERTRVLGNRNRMTHDILGILRIVLRPVNTRYVVNIPLETTWQGPMEDVRVTPSAEQVTHALEHDIAVTDGNCAVCQEGMTHGSRLRNCRHIFHQACITNWFAMSSRCPVCRDDVRQVSDHPGPTPSDEESH